jgi:hypothetical protein
MSSYVSSMNMQVVFVCLEQSMRIQNEINEQWKVRSKVRCY